VIIPSEGEGAVAGAAGGPSPPAPSETSSSYPGGGYDYAKRYVRYV
jgi:hypothetical protein